jgi:hypothetical protein
MTDIVIRNPVGRWLFPVAIGVGQLVLCGGVAANAISQCPQPGTCTSADVETAALIAGPILVILLLVAWVSARAKVTLSDEGIAVRQLLVRATYSWPEITLVRKARSGNLGRPELYVQLVFRDGSETDLPAPRAYGAIGARGYTKRADTIGREWWRREAPPKIQT